MHSGVEIIEPEPAGAVISAFRGNTALNNSETDKTMNLHLNHEPDPETYQTMNLNLNTETLWIFNPEPELPSRTCCVSGYKPIIPVVCGGGLASLTSLKAALGVVVNNKTLHAQKMECVETYHVKPNTSNT